MTSPNLERLAGTGELKAEGFTRAEFDRLLRMARAFLGDAARPGLSPEGRFSLAYGAAHALASAALRLHGYRSTNRYLVFQCLEHTAGLAPGQCRMFSLCHERRNRAEYLGDFDIEPALVRELLAAAENLLQRVSGMAPPP